MDTEQVETLAQRLEKAMALAGDDDKPMTAYRLGQLSEVTQSHIGKLLHGHRVNVTGETGAKLAKALNVSTEWLLTGVGPMRRNDPLSEVSPLEMAIYLEAERVSSDAKRAATEWAQAHEVELDAYAWVAVLRDISRQLSEGAVLSELELPDPANPPKVRAKFLKLL